MLSAAGFSRVALSVRSRPLGDQQSSIILSGTDAIYLAFK